MKKYLLALLMIGNTSWAQNPGWSENQMPVLCGSFREIVITLQKEQYQESPVWVGKSAEDSSRYALFFNEKKGSWTLVRYGAEIGCILGIGVTSEFVDFTNSRPKTY
jgi:hypothetical protein